MFIDAGATLDVKDVWGWTPLMHAIDAHTGTTSREAVLMLLLDAGASVDVWGKDLKGPLDMMAEREEQIKQQVVTAALSSLVLHGVHTLLYSMPASL